MKSWLKLLRLMFKKLCGDRASKAWCECGNETLQDPHSRIYEGGTFTNIICSQCGRQTTWNLDGPVPVSICATAPKGGSRWD